MKTDETKTYQVSYALGKDREVSDEEFFAFAAGETGHMSEAEVTRLQHLLSFEPWKSELELYRSDLDTILNGEDLGDLQNEVIANLHGRRAKNSQETVTVQNLQIGSDTVSPGTMANVLETLRRALAPSPQLGILTTRGPGTFDIRELEQEISDLEIEFGLAARGISLLRFKLAIRELHATNDALNAEVARQREALLRIDDLLKDHKDKDEPYP